MEWINSFFKVVYKTRNDDGHKNKYILEIDPMVVYPNLKWFKNESNFSSALKNEILQLENTDDYSEKIKKTFHAC